MQSLTQQPVLTGIWNVTMTQQRCSSDSSPTLSCLVDTVGEYRSLPEQTNSDDYFEESFRVDYEEVEGNPVKINPKVSDLGIGPVQGGQRVQTSENQCSRIQSNVYSLERTQTCPEIPHSELCKELTKLQYWQTGRDCKECQYRCNVERGENIIYKFNSANLFNACEKECINSSQCKEYSIHFLLLLIPLQ